MLLHYVLIVIIQLPQTVKTSNKANITILYQHLTNAEREKKFGVDTVLNADCIMSIRPASDPILWHMTNYLHIALLIFPIERHTDTETRQKEVHTHTQRKRAAEKVRETGF